jgi:hypothetical protein
VYLGSLSKRSSRNAGYGSGSIDFSIKFNSFTGSPWNKIDRQWWSRPSSFRPTAACRNFTTALCGYKVREFGFSLNFNLNLFVLL